MEYGPEITEDIFEVGSHSIGRELIQTLKNTFTADGKARHGDFYMNQSRALLQRHLQMMSLDEQTTRRWEYAKVKDLRIRVEDARDSWLKRYFLAMKYKRISKKTFKIVERASNRAADDNLMNQIDEAMQDTVDPRFIPEILQSTHSTTFSDSHGVFSVLSGVSIGGLDEVDVEAYQSEVIGGAAVVLGHHRQDTPTQHIVATFSASLPKS